MHCAWNAASHRVVRSALHRRQSRLQHAVMAAWHAHTRTQAAVNAVITRMHDRQARAVLADAFHTWKASVAEDMDERLMLQLCRGHMAHLRVISCLVAWRKIAQIGALHRHVLGLVLRKRTHKIKVRVMLAWAEFVEYQQAGQEAVQQLQQHLQWVKAKQVLAVWKKLTSRRQQLRGFLARGRERLQHRRRRDILLGWRRYTIQKAARARQMLTLMDKAVAYSNARMRMTAFHEWVSVYRMLEGITALRSQRLARLCLRHWRDRLVTARDLQRRLSTHLGLRRCSRLQGTIKAWARLQLQRQHHSQQAEDLWAKHIAAWALNHFRDIVREAKLNKSAHEMWQEHVLIKALLGWQHVQASRKAARLAFKAAGLHVHAEAVLLAWHSWAAYHHHRQCHKVATLRANELHARMFTLKTFEAWTWAVSRRKRQRLTVLQALRHWMHIRQAQAFEAMRSAVAERRSINLAQTHLRKVLLCKCLAGWSVIGPALAKDRVKVQAFRFRSSEQMKAAVLRHWHWHVEWRKELKHSLALFLARHQQRMEHAGMTAFWWNAHLRKHSRTAAAIWFRKTAASVLAGFWVNVYAHQARVAHKQLSKAVAFLNNYTMAKAFNTWVHYWRHRQIKFHAFELAVRWHNARLAAAWKTWREHVQEVQEERLHISMADGFVRKHALAAAWLGLHRYWTYRGRMTKALAMSRLHKLCCCMELWKEAVALSHAMHQAEHRQRRVLKNRAWRAWRYCVHLAQLCEQRLAVTKRRLVRKKWNVWTALVQGRRMHASAADLLKRRITARKTRQALRWVFDRMLAHCRLNKAVQGLRLRAHRGIKQIAFAGWHARAHSRSCAREMLNGRLLSLMAAAFRLWRDAYDEAWEERRAEEARIKLRQILSAFSAWHAFAAYNVPLRQKRYRVERLTSSLRAWKANAAQFKAMKAVLRKISNRMRLGAWNSWRAWLADRQWMHAATGFARQVFVVKTKMQVLAAWKDRMARKHIKDELLNRAIMRMAGHQLRGAFNTWRLSVGQMIGLRRMQRRVAARFMHQMLSRAFAAWRSHTSVKQRLSGIMNKVFSAVQCSLLRRAFNSWLTFCYNSRNKERLQEMAEKYIGTIQHKNLRAAFNTWAEHAHESSRLHRLEATMNKARRAILNRTLRAAFTRWHEIAQLQRYARTTIDELAEKVRARDLGSTFAEWRTITQALAHKRRLLQQAVAFFRGGLATRAFKSWCSFADRKRRYRAAAAVFMQRTLLKAFNTWRGHRMARLVGVAHMLGRNAIYVWAFRQWQDSVREAKDLKEAQAQVEKYHGLWLQSQGMKGWKQWVHRQRLLHNHLSMRQARCRSQVLQHWRAIALLRISIKAKGQQLTKAHAFRCARHVFNVWASVCRAETHHRWHLARTALYGWADAAVYRRDRRNSVLVARHRLLHGRFRRSLRAWAVYTQEAIVKRAMFLRKQRALRDAIAIGDRLVRRQKRRLTTAAFTAWRARAHLLAEAAHMLRRHCARNLRRCLRRWQAYNRYKVARHREMQHAREQGARQLIGRCWRQWSQSASELSSIAQERWREAVSFAYASSAGSAFLAWKAFRALQRQRRVKLWVAFDIVLRRQAQDLKARALHAWKEAMQDILWAEDQCCIMRRQHQRQLLARILLVWSAYTTAMQAEPRPGSPFASPRTGQEVRMIVRRMAAMAGGGHDVDPGSDSEGEIFDGLYDSYGLQQADERDQRMQPYIQKAARAPLISSPAEYESYSDSGSLVVATPPPELFDAEGLIPAANQRGTIELVEVDIKHVQSRQHAHSRGRL
ncbi:hypothetical protein WJX73_006925 [Symbiochloris irregularis]|uniref:Sfi1 spindle body domain-containing protein n=1 Tax=Symbiochloris irregularis TaxID=706552 RepID=A0AAW1PMG9_9CHLO